MTDRVVNYRLSADIAQFQARMSQASASVRKFASDATANTKEAAKFRRGLDDIGSTAGRIGLVAAAGLGAAVTVAANFDQAMSGVEAATRESVAGMESLRAAALKAGQDTAFSASEAAAGIENLAKAGVSTADILGGGLQGALDLAAAGSIDVATAAEAASTAMTQFGLSGSEVPRVADLLSAAAGKASGEVDDFTQALGQVGLVADQTGLSIEETTAGLAAFASAGLLGSDAGTSFKATLAALTPNSTAAKKAMADLGISAFDTAGNFIGLAEFAGQLRTSLGGLTDQQRLATLETIFGSDAVRAASVLYEQGEAGIRDWTAAVDDQGFAAQTAATKLDNLKGDLEAFGGALETALIKSGDGSQGVLRDITQGATEAVKAYSGLPDVFQDTATAALAITAVTGGALWFGSKVVAGVASTREALSNLGDQAVMTRGRLASIGKGVGFATAIIAVGELSEAVDGLLDKRFDDSQLGRSLTALAQGRVTGEIRDVFGEDLGGVGESLDALADGGVTRLYEKVVTLNGLFLDMPTQEASKKFEQLDLALAGLVETGGSEEAAAVIERLGEAAEDSGFSVEDVTKYLDQYKIAVGNAAGETESSTSATEGNTKAVTENAESLADLTKRLSDLRNLRIQNANAEIGYQAAIDDATAAIAENGKTLDINTPKGRANKTALLEQTGAWNELSEKTRGNKRAQREAIDAFAATATQMGMNETAARRLARKLLDIPPKVDTKVTADTSQATSKIDALFRKILNFRPPPIPVGIAAPGYPNAVKRAAGGPVFGEGTATSDSIPAWLSNGEYVVRAAAVDRYGVDFFHRLNAMRFADGGYASRVSTAPVSPSVNVTAGVGDVFAAITDRQVDRLAAAIGAQVQAGAFAGTQQRFEDLNRAAYARRRV